MEYVRSSQLSPSICLSVFLPLSHLGDWLGVDAGHNAEILAHTVKDVSTHPYVISTQDPHAGAHLVLPLTGHHLSVDAGNGDLTGLFGVGWERMS
jgi:hypothetical protein